jgi:hypothetical protein
MGQGGVGHFGIQSSRGRLFSPQVYFPLRPNEGQIEAHRSALHVASAANDAPIEVGGQRGLEWPPGGRETAFLLYFVLSRMTGDFYGAEWSSDSVRR